MNRYISPRFWWVHDRLRMIESINPEWKINYQPGKIILGYKDATYHDFGYFFAPYIPVTKIKEY